MNKTNTHNKSRKDKKGKVERCGFCGRFFKGNEYLKDFEPSGDIPLGYCPEAQGEDYQQNPENYHNRVTRDMAIDAGDPNLEGQTI